MQATREMTFEPCPALKDYVWAKCEEYPRLRGLGKTEQAARRDLNAQIRRQRSETPKFE